MSYLTYIDIRLFVKEFPRPVQEVYFHQVRQHYPAFMLINQCEGTQQLLYTELEN